MSNALENAPLLGVRNTLQNTNEIILTSLVVDFDSQVVFQNITGSGLPQWIALHYSVNDPNGTS